MALLLLKLSLAPSLVVAASLAGRRWGPALSGMLVALPLVAGPILLIAEIEHGQRFGARAAAASLSGIAALALFVLVFCSVSRSRGWAQALGAGWTAFLALALGLSTLALAPAGKLALALGAIALAVALMPVERCESDARHERPSWDLPARAVATAILVVAITGAARALGPAMTGALAPFPVAMSVLAAFVLAQEGRSQANALLGGFLRGAFGFAAFCFLVAILTIPVGAPAAFALALCAAIAVQLLARLAGAGRPASLKA